MMSHHPNHLHAQHSAPAAQDVGPKPQVSDARAQHAQHDHAAMMSDPAFAQQMEKDMARRFLVALALTIPIVMLAGHVPGLPMLVEPPLSSWIALALSTPVVFCRGTAGRQGSSR